MAHPKLTAAVNRSLLAASAAALIAGPMAGAGFAQVEGTVDTLKDLTCEEAKKTQDEKLIAEFCPEEEESESPLSKSVDEVTKTTDKTVKQVEETIAPKKDDGGKGGGESGGGGGGGPVSQLPGGSPTGDGGNDGGGGKNVGGGTNVEGSGNNFNPVDEGRARNNANAQQRNQPNAGIRNAPEGFGLNAPFLPGMQSQSSLTLQPFAGPLVSVPPVYELPQIAQELFGTTTATPAAEDPMVAAGAPGAQASTATAASPYSAAGFSATTADPTGWLAATATGLIMLVGAAHALNGGRTPKREKA